MLACNKVPKSAEEEINEWENDSLDICIIQFERYSTDEIIDKVRVFMTKQLCLQLLSKK